jgi:hypothetical protein
MASGSRSSQPASSGEEARPSAPSPAPPSVPGAPTAGAPSAGGPTAQRREVSLPSSGVSSGGSLVENAPSRPKEPSPVSAETPRTFTPMTPSMSMSEAAAPAAAPVAPSLFNAKRRSSLINYGGGLMGGGLGLAGGGSQPGEAEPTSLILSILRTLNGR